MQQVMASKEIGFTLSEIKSLLENQTCDVQTYMGEALTIYEKSHQMATKEEVEKS